MIYRLKKDYLQNILVIRAHNSRVKEFNNQKTSEGPQEELFKSRQTVNRCKTNSHHQSQGKKMHIKCTR